MIKVQYERLRRAFIVSTQSGESSRMYQWIDDHCRHPVFTDIHLRHVSEYEFRDSAGVGHHYLFFESDEDAMLFKLTWNTSPISNNFWIYIIDVEASNYTKGDGYSGRCYLARVTNDETILVDKRVAHVR